MQKLPEIKATYDWFFTHYAAEIEERARKNDIAGIGQMAAKRDILERGIFVLMFGQIREGRNLGVRKCRERKSHEPRLDPPAWLGHTITRG
jgi:hypothetical protein